MADTGRQQHAVPPVDSSSAPAYEPIKLALAQSGSINAGEAPVPVTRLATARVARAKDRVSGDESRVGKCRMVLPARVPFIIWVFPGGVALFDATVCFFLYLLCISCPMDLQCPIKAVAINE